MFIAAIFTKAKIHIHRILVSHEKNEILPFVPTGLDPEGIMLRETSQTEKDKYHMIPLTCGL